MLILVEGPDCSRKSTLVERLAETTRRRYPRTRVDVLHAGPPTEHPLDEYVTPLLTYRPHADRHVICDRWHLGESVYPAVLGRPTRLDEAVRRYVELFLLARDARLIVITPDEDELRACLERRGDDHVSVDQIGTVRTGFVEVATRTSLPLLWLKDETIDDALVWQLSDEAQLSTHSNLTPYTTYVGPRWPHLLLLGDVRKTGTEPSDLRPAFMPYPATSGHYLLNALGDVTDVGIANACDVDDAFALWNALDRPATVALGRNAQRVVHWADRWAPHPQWARRFKYHEGALYRTQLLGS